MRKILILLLSLCLLCACAAPVQTQTASAPAQASTQKTQAQDVSGGMALAIEKAVPVEPYNCLSACNRFLCSFLYEPLFRVNEKGAAEPVLAEGFFVSDDEKTTTVQIRQGISFSDGTALTAQNTLESLQKAIGSAYYGRRLRHVSKMEAQGQTLVFYTDCAYECLPKLLDIPLSLPSGDDTPYGTGPFAFAENKLTKNSLWQGEACPVSAEEIDLVPVTDLAGLRSAFQFGTVSAASFDPNAGTRLTMQGDFELWSLPTTEMQYVGFNMVYGPFTNGALRCALSYAVDREAIVTEDMDGFGIAVTQAALPGTDVYFGDLGANITYQPEKLRAVASGQTANMIVCNASPQKVSSAKRVAKALSDAGIATTVTPLDEAAFRSALEKGEYDLYFASVRLSPDQDLSPLFSYGSGVSYGGLDAIGEARELCLKTLENSGNGYALQQMILQDGLLCPVAFKTNALYAHRGALKNVRPGISDWK